MIEKNHQSTTPYGDGLDVAVRHVQILLADSSSWYRVMQLALKMQLSGPTYIVLTCLTASVEVLAAPSPVDQILLRVAAIWTALDIASLTGWRSLRHFS